MVFNVDLFIMLDYVRFMIHPIGKIRRISVKLMNYHKSENYKNHGIAASDWFFDIPKLILGIVFESKRIKI